MNNKRIIIQGMNNKSGNDKIGTVFIQDNLVHPDAQHIT